MDSNLITDQELYNQQYNIFNPTNFIINYRLLQNKIEKAKNENAIIRFLRWTALIGMFVIICKIWSNLAKKVDHPFLLDKNWMISFATFGFIVAFGTILKAYRKIKTRNIIENSNLKDITNKELKPGFLPISWNILETAIYLTPAIIITLYLAKIIKPEIAEKTIQVFTWTSLATWMPVVVVAYILLIIILSTIVLIVHKIFPSFSNRTENRAESLDCTEENVRFLTKKDNTLDAQKTEFLGIINGELDFETTSLIKKGKMEEFTDKITNSIPFLKEKAGDLTRKINNTFNRKTIVNITVGNLEQLVNSLRNGTDNQNFPVITKIFNKFKDSNEYSDNINNKTLGYHMLDWVFKELETSEEIIGLDQGDDKRCNVFKEFLQKYKNENNMNNNASDEEIKNHIIDSIMSPKQELAQTSDPSGQQKKQLIGATTTTTG